MNCPNCGSPMEREDHIDDALPGRMYDPASKPTDIGPGARYWCEECGSAYDWHLGRPLVVVFDSRTKATDADDLLPPSAERVRLPPRDLAEENGPVIVIHGAQMGRQSEGGDLPPREESATMQADTNTGTELRTAFAEAIHAELERDLAGVLDLAGAYNLASRVMGAREKAAEAAGGFASTTVGRYASGEANPGQAVRDEMERKLKVAIGDALRDPTISYARCGECGKLVNATYFGRNANVCRLCMGEKIRRGLQATSGDRNGEVSVTKLPPPEPPAPKPLPSLFAQSGGLAERLLEFATEAQRFDEVLAAKNGEIDGLKAQMADVAKECDGVALCLQRLARRLRGEEAK